MIFQALRSLIFYVLFLGQTIILALILGAATLFVDRSRPAPAWMWAVGRYWGWSNLIFLRWVVGIRTVVEGAEHVPAGGCIIASKHQSDWDILALLPCLANPAFIAKRELLDIPFFGWAAKLLNTISVDRQRGTEAIPHMLEEAREKLARNAEIVIFPEGTRRPPLADPNYRAGVTRMYEALAVPVVPVAVNSGFFWGRNSLVLWPGIARARFLPPIPPGLPPAEFRDRLVATIEAASAELALAAWRDGITRPIPPDLRKRLEALAGQVGETTTY